MTARDHDTYAEDLAPYLLGALPPLDSEVLERHLRGCASCQRELSELRTGAEALARSVDLVEAPPTLRERLLDEIAGASGAGGEAAPSLEREAQPEPDRSTATRSAASGRGLLARLRARTGGGGGLSLQVRSAGGRGGLSLRPALAGLAVAATAAIAGVGGWALGTQAGEDERRTLAAQVDRQRLPGARAELEMTGRDGDGVLRLAGLRNLGPRRTYEIWVERDGEIAPGATFSPTARGAAVAGIPEGLAGADAIYVTRERAGGASAPSETPVVSVPLASS